MVSSQLHELIRPVLLYVCDCYLFRQHGVEVALNEVESKLKNLFADIRRKVDGDEFLKREYAQVEKPLVFFVDYFFKENGFSFSKEYEPLARMYNELSGDDKFFDILDKALATSQTSSDVIKSFYLMLGLGFDGAYKRDPKELIPYINGCADRMSLDLNPEEEFLTPEKQIKAEFFLFQKGEFLQCTLLLNCLQRFYPSLLSIIFYKAFSSDNGHLG